MTDEKELIIFYPQPAVGDWVINFPQILIVLLCARGCRDHSFYLNTTFTLDYIT